jgi:Zn-dependent protease with chaperone function
VSALCISGLLSGATAIILRVVEDTINGLVNLARASTVPLLVVLFLTMTGCGTGRAPVPPGEIPRAPVVTPEDENYGQQVLSQLTQKYPLNQNDGYINRCREIVARLAKVARADRALWHVYVLDGDNVANAAATRGNHVFVWTGMLRLVSSDAELAAVLGHELGHVLAGHTQPTPTEEAAAIMSEVGGQVVSGVLSQTPYGPLADIAGILIQTAITAIAVNPGSQANEIEADHIGFFLMSDAGYDPRAALSLWGKMAQSSGGSSTLSFLSSHPTSESRLKDLQTLLPEAERRFQNSSRQTPTAVNSGGSGASSSDRAPRPPSSRDLPTPNSLPPRSGPKVHTPNGSDRTSGAPEGQAAEKSTHEKWRVVESSTKIHTDPDPDAPVVVVLSKGKEVATQFRLGQWYKTVSPSVGFVLGETLTPEP